MAVNTATHLLLCHSDYAAIWVHHQNLSIHLQRHQGPIDEFLLKIHLQCQSHSPFLTSAHKVNMELTCAEKTRHYIENRNNTGTS